MCLIYTRKGEKIGTRYNEEQVDRIVTFASEIQATMRTMVDIYSYNIPRLMVTPAVTAAAGKKPVPQHSETDP